METNQESIMTQQTKSRLRCPHCSEITTVYHHQWEAILCSNCEKEVNYEEWQPVYFDSTGTPINLSQKSIELIMLRRDIERVCLLNDYGEITESQLDVSLQELRSRYLNSQS